MALKWSTNPTAPEVTTPVTSNTTGGTLKWSTNPSGAVPFNTDVAPSAFQNVKDVGVGAAKTVTGFVQGANVLDTMQRIQAGEGVDKTRLNLAEAFDSLGATRRIFQPDLPESFNGLEQPAPFVGAPSTFTGQTPEEEKQALTPSNTYQKIGSIGTIAALGLSPMVADGSVGKVLKGAAEKAKKAVTARAEASNAKVADQIYDIETNYAKLRDKNNYSKDGGEASRARIAQSNVLVDTVGKDYKVDPIRIKDAAKSYQEQTIDGAEGVVRTRLEHEGTTVNIAEIEKGLVQAIKESKLPPEELATALSSGIGKQLEGLMTKADELGNIKLTDIHDAKINTTAHIDYTTPAEVKTYRKAVARVYKEIVENNSMTNVKEVNAELAKYYGDIERIQNLSGRIVKGGKIGKYAAQITGNLVGGALGSVLGPVGAAGGAVIGGETTAFIKGRQAASTFGKDTGTRAPKSPILENARNDVRVINNDATVKKSLPDTPPLAQKTISSHITTAEHVLKDMPIENFRALGGMPALLERTKVNIADGLEKQGFKALADHVRNFDLAPFTDFESFKKAIIEFIAKHKDESGKIKVPFLEGKIPAPQNLAKKMGIGEYKAIKEYITERNGSKGIRVSTDAANELAKEKLGIPNATDDYLATLIDFYDNPKGSE